MSKFFKSLLLLLSAGLFTATSWAAEPWASWTDFRGLISGEWALELNGNTLADDGTVTISSKPVILDLLTSDYNPNNANGGITVVLKASGIQRTQNSQVFVNIGSSTENSVGFASKGGATSNEAWVGGAWQAQYWDNASNPLKPFPVDQGTYLIFVQYANDNGTKIYYRSATVEGAATTICEIGGLKAGGGRVDKIYLGSSPRVDSGKPAYPAGGMKIHAVAVYKTQFTEKERNAYTFPESSLVMGTLNESATWNRTSWTPEKPTNTSNVTLNISADSTLTMDETASVTGLAIAGTGALIIAKTDSNKLTSSGTIINTDTTVNVGAASLGAVTIASGKTLTVGDGYFSSPTTINDMPISGTGTLALELGAENTLQLSGSNSNKPFGLKVLSGRLEFPQKTEGSGPGYGRTIIVSGENSVLATGTNTDATGWNVTGNQSLQLLDGAKMLVYKRDTFKTPLTMRDATIELQSNAADGSRGLDWFDQTTELKVLARADASPTSPTISKITYNAAIGQGDARKFRIRKQDVNGAGFFVNVAENAQLMIDMVIEHSGETSFKKRGVGELVLTAANTFTCPLTVEAGTLHLTKSASTPQGAIVTINDGATLAGTGTINGTLTFNAGATIDATKGAITASGTVSLPSTLKVKLSKSLAALDVVPLMTTASTTDVTGKAVSVSIDNGEFDESSYILKSDAKKLWLVKKEIKEIGNFAITLPTGVTSQSLSASLPSDLSLAENATLAIHFTEAEQTFAFDTAASLATVTITAEEGVTDGTIEKSDDAGTVTIADINLLADVKMLGTFLRDCIKAQTVNIPEAKTLSISVPDGTTDWDCALNQFFEGSGTLKKIGNGSLNVIPRENSFICYPKILIAEGSVRFASNTTLDYAEPFDITVESGAMLKIGYGAALTNENTTIILKDGATLELKNVNTSSITAAKIVVDNGAKIQTQQQASPLKNAFFSGTISGYGTLVFDSNFDLPMEFSGVISDKSATEKLKVQVAKSTGSITFTGANTYTGGTEIAAGATLKVQKMSALGAANTNVNIAQGGKVVVTSASNSTEDNNAARAVFAGEGTVEFNGSGYYILPQNFKAPAYLINNQGEGLIISKNGTHDLGSYSGDKVFRMDYNETGDRTLLFIQRADAMIADDVVSTFGAINDAQRLTDVTVKGVNGATLTLRGAHNNIHFRTLTIDATGSVNLAGGWKGNVVASGRFAGNGTIGGTLTFEDNSTLDATAGTLTVSGAVNLPNELTVKVAAAPTEETPVTILKTSATPDVTKTTVTLVPAEGTVDGQYDLIKDGNLLQVIPHVERIAAGTTCQVDTVPKKIYLDTATFTGGYGTEYTVLQYTGEEDKANWESMTYYGLPKGAEIIKTDTTWGFVNNRLNVLPIGDSITAGLVTYDNSSANWHVPGGYRLPLYQFLTQAGYDVNYVGTSNYAPADTDDTSMNSQEMNAAFGFGVDENGNPISAHHEGHSGATLDGGNVNMLTRFNNPKVLNIIASQGVPDVITLHLGTNDFDDTFNTEENPTAGDENAEAVFDRMTNLLDKLQALYPNTKIFVAKIIARSGAKNAKVKVFNALLDEYFTSNPMGNLILVDLNIKDVSYGLLRYDGLHPSTEGYTQMARGFFAAIEQNIAPLSSATTIASVDARVANTLKVVTNLALAKDWANKTWALTNATVNGVTIADDLRTVTLSVSGITAGTEYTLSVEGLEAYTFTAPADIHTPTMDVINLTQNPEDATQNAYNKANGLLKAAEWTTFKGYASGYTSPVGYMPDANRAWKLESEIATATDDGVLSLNGAPLTVNVGDGRIGTTKGAYSAVMKVSDLVVGDELLADSTRQKDGTVNIAKLFTVSVLNSNKLQVKFDNNEAKTVSWEAVDALTGVSLTDDIPDVITIVMTPVHKSQYKSIAKCTIFVNGTTICENMALSTTEFSEIYRGNFTITPAAESEMKLYRLSFYEGEVTAIAKPVATINVGTDAGEYTTWSAAKEALDLEDTMTSVAINFTDVEQTFEFNNATALNLGAVTIQGEAGTIAKASNADVKMASLSLQTNVTAPVAFYNGCAGPITTASATTVVAMNDATAATLTATIVDGTLTQVGKGTVTFAPETWSSSVTPKKFEVVKGTLTFDKACTGWNNPPQLIVSGGTLDLNDTHTYNATDGSGYLKDVSSEPLVIMGGATASTIEGGAITPWIANANAGEKTMIKYVGNGGQNAPATFAANIDGVYSPENHIRIIDVEKGAQTSGYDLAITGAIGVTEDCYMKVENGTMKGSTLKKSGAGTLLLSGTNNFPYVTISEGVLKLGSATAFSEKVKTITIAEGATLDLNGQGISLTNVTISGAGQVIDSAETKGSLTLSGTSTINALNGEGIALVIATGAKLTAPIVSLGDITLQEGAVLVDTTDNNAATNLGTCVITVTKSDAEGDRAVIARQNPFNGNSDTFVTSDVTLKGAGNLALAGMCGGEKDVFFQALNFAAGTDFSGEISVFNQYAKDTQVTIANSHLAKATYMFIDSVANVGSNVEGSHTLTLESEDEVTLAAIGQAFVTTPMRPMSLVINAPLTVTNGITVTGAGTISGEGSIVLGEGSTLCYESSEASTFNGCITGALSVTKGPLTLATVDDSDAKKNELTNLTISGTKDSKAALRLERPTTISGTAEVKTSGESAEYAAQLILSNEVTLKNGATLTLREYAVVDAAALSVTPPMLVIAGGATICCDSAKSYQVTCPIKFEAGAIVDTATYSKDNATEKLNAYLRYTGGARNLTFPEDGKVIFKIKHNGTFLAVPVFLDAQTEGLNKQWAEFVELKDSNGTSWSTENHYIVTREKFREFHVGVQKAKIKNASPELEAYAAKLAYELSIWSTIPTDVTSVDNLEYDSCFLNYGASGLVNGKLSLYADFGINDVKVLKRTIESVTKDQVAIEVKVGNGAGKPADLRDTSVIYFSTDGKAFDDPEKVWLAATRLTSEDLENVGLTNGEGVYWFWAGDLPTIEPGTTSTTHHYKVKAVNTTYDSQPTPSSQQ